MIIFYKGQVLATETATKKGYILLAMAMKAAKEQMQ